MGALVLVMRAESRRRWRGWLALVLLIALVGGVVLAAAAAGRRTDSAFPGFLAAHGFDAAVYTTKPWPSTVKFAEVTSVTELIGPDTGQPTCACAHPINPTDFGVIFAPPKGRNLSKLVSGRWPDPSAPDQVLASFTLQQDYGVHLGTVILVPFYSAGQASAVNNAIGAPPQPDGPVVALRVVGFEATEYEFPSGTSSFLRSVRHARLRPHRPATDGLRVRVRRTATAWSGRLGPVRLAGQRTGRQCEQ